MRDFIIKLEQQVNVMFITTNEWLSCRYLFIFYHFWAVFSSFGLLFTQGLGYVLHGDCTIIMSISCLHDILITILSMVLHMIRFFSFQSVTMSVDLLNCNFGEKS